MGSDAHRANVVRVIYPFKKLDIGDSPLLSSWIPTAVTFDISSGFGCRYKCHHGVFNFFWLRWSTAARENFESLCSVRLLFASVFG